LSTVSADPGIIYVNNATGNDSWDGQSATYTSGLNGPKLSIKNATLTVNPNGIITIANGQYAGTGNTQITIDRNMTISGESQAGTIINGSDTTWIFHILSGVTVTLQNLTITNGNSTWGFGTLQNEGTLTVANCNFTNNYATWGGAVYNGGTLTVSNSNFDHNSAGLGGAIGNGGTLNVTGSIFTNNHADGYGGVIYNNYGNLNVEICDFITNTAGNGAIFNNYGNCNVTSSNFTDNHATLSGGALNNERGNLTVISNNFISNSANLQGGAIADDHGNLTAHFNRIVGNSGYGIVGYSVVDSDSGTVDIENNWWGSNHPDNDWNNLISGFSPPINWVFLSINATPSSINNTQTSLITASFNNLCNGTTVTPYIPGAGEYIPNGTPVTFSLTNGPFGTLTAPFTGNTLGGLVSILFTATSVGVQAVNGTLDEQNVTTSITILAAHVDLETFYADYNEFVNNNHNIVTITDPVNYLDQVIVVFTATNMGPNPVTDLVLREDWPSQLMGTGDVWHTFDGINWIQESYLAQGSFNLYPTYAGPLNMGDVVWIVFGATVNASNTIITNTVSTTEQEPIDNEGFDTASADLQVNPEANLTITKTGSDTVIAGNQITYTLTATNNGPDPAANVIISDTFPLGMSDISWTANYAGGASGPTSGTGNLNINLGTFPVGGSCIITVNGTVSSAIPADTILSNTVTITTSAHISDPANATDTVTTTVERESDIALSKTVDNARPDVGDTVTFIVTAHNNGPSDADNIQILDLMPSSFADIVITPSNGTYNNLTGIWTLNLNSGETATLNLTGKISRIMAGKNATNNATLMGSTQTTNATIYVPKSDLYIQITSDKNNPTVGETFILTYKLGNNGPDDTENVTITIPLPDGFVISKIEGDGNWTVNGNTITWTMKNVTVGDPYLYISGWTTGPGIYLFSASIASETYSINSMGVNSLSLNALPQANAATSNTVGMQTTGAPIEPLALAVLSVLCGLIGTRKKQ
jgi:uncharacterized repeat protein (TIGR01451 family)